VIANLSRLGQQTQLDLSEFNGCRLINLFGPVEYTPVTESKYPFTLGPYAYYWFALQPRQVGGAQVRTLPAEEVARVPTLVRRADELFDSDNLEMMEIMLQNYIKGRRWFRGKARDIQWSRIRDVIPLRSPECQATFVLIQVNYIEGEPETYIVPLSVVSAERAGALRREQPQAIVARLQSPEGGSESLLCDAMADNNFGKLLLQSIGRRGHFPGKGGRMIASPTPAFFRAMKPEETVPEPTAIKAEQTNTSISYGDRLILKLFRQLGEGINPELEIGRFLLEKTHFTNVPPLAGALEYYQEAAAPISLAVLQSFVPNEGDAWQYTQESLEKYFQYVHSRPVKQVPPLSREHLLSLPREIPVFAREAIGTYLVSAQVLGQRTAELHIALASDPDDPEFAPEPFSFAYRTSLYQSLRSQTVRTLQLLREKLPGLPEDMKESARRVVNAEKSIIERYRLVQRQDIAATRIRIHGDYHLGQVLNTGKDFVIIDFEGETDRPLSARRTKRLPLKDVAGMIRSLDYAAHTALLRQVSLAPRPEDELAPLRNWAQYWYVWVAATFLAAYLDNIRNARLLPEDTGQLKILLDAFLLERAVYEIGYELNNRPDWLKVPIEGVLQLTEASP
jgi:maltose alpha-D-glucosyltransferase/alpha-amylase